VIPSEEGLVDLHRDARVDVSRGADRTFGPVAERRIDQRVASHQDVEIHPPGEADVFGCKRHVAAGILDADDVFDGGQLQDRGGRERDLRPVRVGVEQDRQVGAGLRNGRVVRDEFPLTRNEEVRGNGRHRADTEILRHLCGFNRLAGGHGAGSRVNGNPVAGLVDNDPDGFFFLFEGERKKFPLASDREKTVNPAVDQVIGQFPERAFVDASLIIQRRNHCGDDSLRNKWLHNVLLHPMVSIDELSGKRPCRSRGHAENGRFPLWRPNHKKKRRDCQV